jgi:D-apionolactonase
MPLDQTILRAGPLTVVYDHGDFRYVRLGDHEILRRVFMLVRDHNWGTAANTYSHEHLERGADWFTLTYDAVSRRGEINFAWTARLSGTADGTLSFGFEGAARTTFRRNRLGLLVLHPGQICAGAPARVEQVDGRVVETAFPRFIAPQQPFTDISVLAHEALPGVWASVRFSGDVFETEDQRNWSDASFKTYSGPTRLPSPVEVPAGTRIAQSMTLRLSGAVPALKSTPAGAEPQVSIGPEPAGRLPALGLGVASHGQPLTEVEIQRLRALPLSHLRVDLRLNEPGWPARLRQAAAEAGALGVALEPALHLPADAEAALKTLVSGVDRLRPPIARWLIYSAHAPATTAAALTAARRHLAGYDSNAPIFGGSDAYFAQLNMNRPPLALVDGLTYATNPQGHTFDTASMMETFEAHAAAVRSAQQFSDGRRLVVSPVTLRPRFNPVTYEPEPPPPPGELPFETDRRQREPEAAAWTVGSLASLAQTGGLESVTYYETTGWRGLMESAAGSLDPAAFPSQPLQLFPVYRVFAALAAWRGAEVLPVTVTQPLKVAGLALRRGGAHMLMVANLTDQPQTVRVAGLGPHAAMRSVGLGAYAFAQLEA